MGDADGYRSLDTLMVGQPDGAPDDRHAGQATRASDSKESATVLASEHVHFHWIVAAARAPSRSLSPSQAQPGQQ